MKSYLTKYSYQNTLTPQLWAELEAASSLPVTSVMKTWTEQVRGANPLSYPICDICTNISRNI